MSVHWGLSQVVVWIAARNDEAVAEAPDAIALLLLVDREGSGVPEAKAELWEALEAGGITATGIAPDGERHTIPAERWHDLQPYFDRNTETLQRPGFHPGTPYNKVIVASAAVRKEWPADPAAPALAVRRKGGPKPKVDLEAFRAEVIRLIDENGYPDPIHDPDWRQADLEKHMLEWVGETLSVSRVRHHVAGVMRDIKASFAGN